MPTEIKDNLIPSFCPSELTLHQGRNLIFLPRRRVFQIYCLILHLQLESANYQGRAQTHPEGACCSLGSLKFFFSISLNKGWGKLGGIIFAVSFGCKLCIQMASQIFFTFKIKPSDECKMPFIRWSVDETSPQPSS